MHVAQKAPSEIVVSRMSWVALMMVPLAVSSMPNGNRECEREVHRLVRGVLFESEGMGTRDVGGCKGGAGAEAGWDFQGGGVDEADKGTRYVDRDVLRAEEPGVVATVPDEELLFDSGVRFGERAALWLEDGSDAPVGRYDVEACEEAVVR
jgi:hypothetical protein